MATFECSLHCCYWLDVAGLHLDDSGRLENHSLYTCVFDVIACELWITVSFSTECAVRDKHPNGVRDTQGNAAAAVGSDWFHRGWNVGHPGEGGRGERKTC